MKTDQKNYHCENVFNTKNNLQIQCFGVISIKIKMSLHKNRKTKILKFALKHKRLQTVKTILSKNNHPRSITTPDFKLYFRATVTKSARQWQHRKICGSVEQNQEPRYKPNYSHLNLHKDAQKYTLEKRQNSAWETGCLRVEE